MNTFITFITILIRLYLIIVRLISTISAKMFTGEKIFLQAGNHPLPKIANEELMLIILVSAMDDLESMFFPFH